MLSQFHDLLTKIGVTSSSNEKVTVLKAVNNNDVIRDLLRRALDPTITFGVKQLPDPQHTTKLDEEVGLARALDLLTRLERRELTGGAAQREIANVLGSLCERRAEALRRILLKDLRVGVTAKTVNKALPGTVPMHEVQLAPSELVKPSTLTYPVWGEIKYDGYRATYLDGKLISRNGNPFDNFREIQEYLWVHNPKDVVIDMELMSPFGFSALKKRGGADLGKNIDIPIYAVIFDVLTREEWDSKNCPTPFSERRQRVEKVMEHLPTNLFQVAEGKRLYSSEETLEFYQHALAKGCEGLMIKQINGPYTFARNGTWRKMKPYETMDLKVTHLIVGQGKYAGMLGAIGVEGEFDGKLIKGTVGSGFTDRERVDLWTKDDIVGKTMEVRYLEITKAEDNDHWALRHGTFVRWRDDK